MSLPTVVETCDKSAKKPKRSFVDAWLNDERYKCWIRKVPSDETLYHCTVCNQDFSCNAAHVSRHVESACHRNNLKENLSTPNDDEVAAQNKTTARPMFKHEWLDIGDFKVWLREIPQDETMCSCAICDKSFVARLSHVRRHAESRGHLNLCKEKGIEVSESSNVDLRQNRQNNEPLLLFDDRKKSAEIKYAALIADGNIPLQFAQEILSFFQHIGKEPAVLKKMSLHTIKCEIDDDDCEIIE